MASALLAVCCTGRGKRGTVFGKFSLIDLAGSERGADTSDTCKKTRQRRHAHESSTRPIHPRLSVSVPRTPHKWL
jgi:hypothetical protein